MSLPPDLHGCGWEILCHSSCFPISNASFLSGYFWGFSLYLASRNLMWLGFFRFISSEIHSASWICDLMFCAKFGKFLAVTFLDTFPVHSCLFWDSCRRILVFCWGLTGPWDAVHLSSCTLSFLMKRSASCQPILSSVTSTLIIGSIQCFFALNVFFSSKLLPVPAGGGGVDVQTPPWPCTDCAAARSPPGVDTLLPQPCWHVEGEGEGWLAGLVSAGGGPGLSSSLLPVCTSVGLREGEPSPASHAWFPLIDVRCKLPFMLGGCGDLVTHQVLLTLKTGMGGQWVTIPVCCHLLQP